MVVALLGLYLLLTSAFYPLDFLAVFDAKRVLQTALFVVITVFATFWKPLRNATCAQIGRLSTLQWLALGLFFLIGLISSIRLEHPAYALADVAIVFIMMVSIAIVAGSRSLAGPRFDSWAVIILTVTGFAVVTQEFMGFAAGWAFGSEFSYDQALIHFAHPRFYNQLQTWSIPIIAAIPLVFPKTRYIKVGSVILIGLQCFLIIALSARGTTVSLLIAITFIALWLPPQRRFWLRLNVIGLLIGIVIYSGVVSLNEMFIPKAETGDFYSYSVGRPIAHTSGRTTLWRLSLEDAIGNPILGTGPTRYACDNKGTTPAHPHNFLLQVMGEWGFIAFILLVFLTGSIGLKYLKSLKFPVNQKNLNQPLSAILAISLIAGIMHSGLSGLLIMPASQIAAVLIGGWTLSLSSACPNTSCEMRTRSPLLLIATLIPCILFLFTVAEIPLLSKRTEYSVNYGQMLPRYWQDGRVCEYLYLASNSN